MFRRKRTKSSVSSTPVRSMDRWGEAAIALSPISLPDLDPGRRLLAVCATPKGEVNARLVRQGLAWAFVKFSDTYVSEEAEARTARRGVFATQNEPPWEFRAHRWD